MDVIRPIGSTGVRGDPSDVGGRDSEGDGEKKERDARLRIVGLVVVISILVSAIFGFAFSGLHGVSLAVAFIAGSFVSLILGMSAGSIWFGYQTKKAEERLERQAENFDFMIEEALEMAKKECGVLSVNMAKIVAGRVADRIVARHAVGLLKTEYREAILQETNNIVDEEVENLRRSVS